MSTSITVHSSGTVTVHRKSWLFGRSDDYAYREGPDRWVDGRCRPLAEKLIDQIELAVMKWARAKRR